MNDGRAVARSWSAADADGVESAVFDVTARFPLGRRRWRRAARERLDLIGTWPAAQRALLGEWLAGAAPSRRWDSLLKIAGGLRVELARRLCDDLLRDGWIERCERREPRRDDWQWTQIAWRRRDRLHAALGLPPPDLREQVRARLSTAASTLVEFAAALDDLQDRASGVALRRLGLLQALQDWKRQSRDGTRREFAQFAGAHTKSIADADWRWLDEQVDLEALGVRRHSPALWLRAPLRLRLAPGELDLRAVPDLIGLSPATVTALAAADGAIGCWRLVENRTSFEHAARALGDRDGVIWLPGQPPAWWFAAVRALLRVAPAPLRIACDPDPAGIEIALSAAQCWEERGLAWSAWQMDAAALAALPKRLPLGDDDPARIARLDTLALPPALRSLLEAMRAQDAKGEQEGLDLTRD
ncbi:hypothetical protein [Tahibacter caeni]|uniref:hypothetical protein n=1 Tax=Tahibacter caeni TaxID=1453545 RepID=UPI0021488A5E|nr:hypothetical protein [Tahibacter caeni]